MKIAYFIMLHHKPQQFRWLFEAIYNDEDFYCIHLDRRSGDTLMQEVNAYIGFRHNVCFTPSRNVVWGGWSQVDAELAAIRHALAANSDWQYFVNLSGQDYPIKPLTSIKEKLRTEWPRNFIRVWSFEKIRELQPDDPHLARKLTFEAWGNLVRTRFVLPFPKRMDIKYKGSSWHMLTRDFCHWLDTAPMTARVTRAVKHVFAPDETFHQALLMNSPFHEQRMDDSYRLVIWPGPKILRMEDLETIAQSNCLFARKFDESVDASILRRLAESGGYKVPSPPSSVNRGAFPGARLSSSF